MRYAIFDVLKKVKKSVQYSLIYSSDAMDIPYLYINNGFDFVIKGEGEETTKQIIELIQISNLEKGLENIPGIFYKKHNEIKFTGHRKLIQDLNNLPDPDYSFVNIQTYKKIWLEKQGYFSLNVSTSRGCPFSCNWCAKPLYGNNFHSYSPRRISNLIANLIRKFEVSHIWFTDDIFGLKYSWLKEFNDLITNEKIEFRYKCLSRVDLLLKGETIKLLKTSGCETIWTGVESGSQKILDAMDKGITIDQINRATALAKKNKIKIAYFIQFGYLGEDWNDINLTRRLIKDNMPDDIGISVSYPLQGTKFYSIVKSSLKDKKNWTDSDDLDLMYAGTYHSAFYKVLHRFIHSEYNLRKIIKNRVIKKIPLLPLLSIKYVYYFRKLRIILNNTKEHPVIENEVITLI